MTDHAPSEPMAVSEVADQRTRVARHVWLGVFVAITVVLIARCPRALRHPSLPYEDGTQWFPQAYDGGLSQVFAKHESYALVLPKLMAYVSGFLPTTCIPYAFVWLGIVSSALCFSSVAARRMSGLLPGRWTRFVAAIAIAAVPAGNWALVYTTYSSFHLMGFALFVLAFAGAPDSRWRGAWLVLMVALVWSTPACALLLPWFLWSAFRSDRNFDRVASAVLAAAVVSYLLFGATPSHASGSLGIPTLGATVHYILVRVFFEGFAGAGLREDFGGPDSNLTWVVGAALALAVCFLVVKSWPRLSREQRRFQLFAAYAIVGVSLLVNVTRGGTDLMNHWGQRYCLIQKLLLLLAIASAAVTMTRGLPRKALWCLAAVTLAWLVQRNRDDRDLYWYPIGDSPKVMEFVHELSNLEHEKSSRRGIHLELPRNDWPIVIDTR